MAAGKDDKKKEQGKGFAGLSSLVSDVGTTPPPAAKKATTSSAAATPSASRPAAQATAHKQPQSVSDSSSGTWVVDKLGNVRAAAKQSEPLPRKSPQQPGPGSSSGKWWIGIAAVIGVFWLIDHFDKNSSSPAPTYSSPAHTTPRYSPSSEQLQMSSRPAESKPPVGQDLEFSQQQIAYCVAEDIRMEGAKAGVDSYSASDVDRFNAMVTDYNSRCSSFRYRRGVLESVRANIEPYRSQLYSEGQQRLVRDRTQANISSAAPKSANNAKSSTSRTPSAQAASASTPVKSSARAAPGAITDGTAQRGGDRGMASRTHEEVDRMFDANKGRLFALYNRALRENPVLQGKVVLKLTIASDGRVQSCTIVSSELHDPELEKALVLRVLQFQFEPKEVDTITLTKPIDFFPA